MESNSTPTSKIRIGDFTWSGLRGKVLKSRILDTVHGKYNSITELFGVTEMKVFTDCEVDSAKTGCIKDFTGLAIVNFRKVENLPPLLEKFTACNLEEINCFPKIIQQIRIYDSNLTLFDFQLGDPSGENSVSYPDLDLIELGNVSVSFPLVLPPTARRIILGRIIPSDPLSGPKVEAFGTLDVNIGSILQTYRARLFPSHSVHPFNFSVIPVDYSSFKNLKELKITAITFDDPNVLLKLPNQLEGLYLGETNLVYLPKLPGSLKNLVVSQASIEHIPKLPKSLKTMRVDLVNIKFLVGLPKGLKRLIVRWCDRLESMDIKLPPRLIFLEFVSCKKLRKGIQKFVLPESLVDLTLNDCGLKKLPKLPSKLETLFCNDNRLASLPLLPDSLKFLCCSNNNLSKVYPPRNMKEIHVQDNPRLFFVSPVNVSTHWSFDNEEIIALVNSDVYQRFYDTFISIRAKRTFLKKIRFLIARRKELARKVSILIDYAPGGKHAKPSEVTRPYWWSHF